MRHIRETMEHAERFPPRRELHCARDVAEALVRLGGPVSGQPWAPGVDLVLVLDVVVEGDMPSGQWQIRDADGTILDQAHARRPVVRADGPPGRARRP